MLGVMSFEVPAESIGTVTRAQSWSQRIASFSMCDRQTFMIAINDTYAVAVFKKVITVHTHVIKAFYGSFEMYLDELVPCHTLILQ